MKILLVIMVSVVSLYGVSGMTQTLPGQTSPAQTATAVTPDQAGVAKGNNAFAVDLYGQLKKRDGNLFFSPESISTALAMTYAGARGTTATEMAAALHFTLPAVQLHPAMGALLSALNAPHNGYQLRVADALWAEKDYHFLDEYLKLTKDNYGAGFRPVDFKNASGATRGVINQWVEQATEGKIKDLIPADAITPMTRLVLTNAIYFKGDWQTQFAKAATSDEDFHVSATETVKTPLMRMETRLRYFSADTFQAVDIPYKQRELSMVVLLPHDVDRLSALEQSMTEANAQKWLNRLEAGRKVILTLPKFKMTSEFELADALGALGMKQAFERGVADFSGMTGTRDLWISAAIHKAYVDVNEEGTEAAAATGIVMHTMAMSYEEPPVVFRADHPFIFLIRDDRSGAILFMGRVVDPTK
jgi:serpin B